MAPKQKRPNSYKDPYWSDLAAEVEKEQKLPGELLKAIILHGEKTNADQVSEVGARTPFQILPATRDQYLKETGIDAYLNDKNAAEIAGRHLGETLKRTNGNIGQAIAEYHAGPNQKGWGPKTKAYHDRVLTGLEQMQTEKLNAGAAKAYQAYSSGQMTSEQSIAFENLINQGTLTLPEGAALKTGPNNPDVTLESVNIAPEDKLTAGTARAYAAYAAGEMTPEQSAGFEQLVNNGTLTLPEGAALKPGEPTLMDQAGNVIGGIKEAFTGAARETEATRTLPDWGNMPELNELSSRGFKAAIGTLTAAPEEAIKVIQANYPEIQVNQDEKGNYLLTSAKDGQTYAIKPGFRVSDIPKVVGGALAFTPAAKAATIVGGGLLGQAAVAGLGAGATQAGIETAQQAVGGEFNPEDVALATALGAGGEFASQGLIRGGKAVAQRLLKKPTQEAVEQAVSAAPPPIYQEQPLPGIASEAPLAPAPIELAAEPVPTTPGGRPAFAEAPPSIPTPEEPSPLTMAEMGRLTAKAAQAGPLGKKKAMQTLAGMVEVDPETYAAAERLGFVDYLQPEHLTTNQAFREIAQAVKTEVGSAGRAQQLQGLKDAGQAAVKLVEDLGATEDLSSLSQAVRNRFDSTIEDLTTRADDLYQNLRDNIPATTKGPATNALDFINTRVEALGGEANLSKLEKVIVRKLRPKTGEGTSGPVHPSYALIDDVRRDVGSAARAKGPFANEDTGLAKKLYGLLSDDQRAIVESQGMVDTYDAATAAVRARKALEDDAKSLFGKQLGNTIVGDISRATQGLSKGDTGAFVKLVKAIPEDMRQETVASALMSAFGKESNGFKLNFNNFANWYAGLKKNKQAYTALFSNLPKGARQQMEDLYLVSEAVAKASKERIPTGRGQAAKAEIEAGAQSLIGTLYSMGKKALVTEAISSSIGLPGTGTAAVIGSALTKNKTTVMEAADKLLMDPAFKRLVIESAKKGTKR